MADAKKDEKPKKKSMLPIIIGVVALLGVLFVAKGMLAGGKPKEEAKSKKEKGKKDKEKEKVEVGISLPLDEFVVNLGGGNDHYLRATIALGLKKGLTEEMVKEHVAPMRDAILTILSAKTLDELNKPKGHDKLKEELIDKINEEVENEPVVKVYFTAFATQ